ncbi:MAG: haloacid dehalogenase-like hydrolase [Lachnospiraceae bacterium]|nr:haloacid dehalogenase-like hydrolase [Lachnospiraceae bacterium]
MKISKSKKAAILILSGVLSLGFISESLIPDIFNNDVTGSVISVKAKNESQPDTTFLTELSGKQASLKANSSASFKNWNNNSATVKKLKTYIKKITDSSDKTNFIPKKDRIAVFDLDGTLLCETYPTFYERLMFINYALYDHPEKVSAEIKAVAKDCEEKSASEVHKLYPTDVLTGYFAKAYAGLSVDELYDYTTEFGKKSTPYFKNLKYGEAFYLPMTDIVKYLYKNDFTLYVVSGTETTCIRAIIGNSPLKAYIQPDHIIGTEFEIKIKGHENEAGDHLYEYEVGDEAVYTGKYLYKNVKARKVINIIREIGKKPVLAFGNRSSDNSMCYYTINDNPYPAKAFIVVADDGKRDQGKSSNMKKKISEYKDSGIDLISMKNEFTRIYSENMIVNQRL